jgi:RNA polymerase sigma factor (sigma-70 family)
MIGIMSLHESLPLAQAHEQPVEHQAPDRRIITLQSDTESPEAKEEAFVSIVDEFEEPLSHYAARIVGSSRAEDVVQDALFGAWLKIGEFRPEGDRALSNWLYRITRNRALNETRRDQYRHDPADHEVSSHADGPDAAISHIASHTGDPVAQCEFNEDIATLKLLPEAQREALALRIFGYSPGEIAVRQSTSLPSAKAKLFRGRQAAQRVLRPREA